MLDAEVADSDDDVKDSKLARQKRQLAALRKKAEEDDSRAKRGGGKGSGQKDRSDAERKKRAKKYWPRGAWNRLSKAERDQILDDREKWDLKRSSNDAKGDDDGAVKRANLKRQIAQLEAKIQSSKEKLTRELKVEYCPTAEMRGDFFTKPLQGTLFRKFRDQILNIQV